MIVYLNWLFNQEDNALVLSAHREIVDRIHYRKLVLILATAIAHVPQVAKNRLIVAEPESPGQGDQKLEFAYDYMGRRVQKAVFDWDPNANGGVGGWETAPSLDRRFVWYNWLMLLELDENNTVVRKYTWGLDLAGQNGSVNDIESAGGIGGLLGTYDAGTTKSYTYFYDGNGNVGQVIDADDGTIAVRYEYDPYGNRVNTPDQGELDQPFRFSTKYYDGELDYPDQPGYPAGMTDGVYYFGHRYYRPHIGRWLNRDPLGELGGQNLYAFVANAPTVAIDPHGLYAGGSPGQLPAGAEVSPPCPGDDDPPEDDHCPPGTHWDQDAYGGVGGCVPNTEEPGYPGWFCENQCATVRSNYGEEAGAACMRGCMAGFARQGCDAACSAYEPGSFLEYMCKSRCEANSKSVAIGTDCPPVSEENNEQGCPAVAPGNKADDGWCRDEAWWLPGNPWHGTRGLGPDLGPNTCYRGYGANSDKQCCYTPDGCLIGDNDHQGGTRDMVGTAEGEDSDGSCNRTFKRCWGHFWQDMCPNW